MGEKYAHPHKGKEFSVCKNCSNDIARTEAMFILFCQEHDLYFDKNLYNRAYEGGTQNGKNLVYQRYGQSLNMNKGVNRSKTFKDSVFDVPQSVQEFHGSKRFEARQEMHFCRYCRSEKNYNEYFATACPLDKSGLLSVCKTCVGKNIRGLLLKDIEKLTGRYMKCAIF